MLVLIHQAIIYVRVSSTKTGTNLARLIKSFAQGRGRGFEVPMMRMYGYTSGPLEKLCEIQGATNIPT